jgi:hypothetical protein
VQRALRGEDIRAQPDGGEASFAAAQRRDRVSSGISADTLDKTIVPTPLPPLADFNRPNSENRAGIRPVLDRHAALELKIADDGRVLTLSQKRRAHLEHDAKGPDGFRMLSVLPDIVRNAIHLTEEPNNSAALNVKAVHRYISAVHDGDQVRAVRITVHETPEGNALHSVNVLPKEERLPGNMQGLASAHLTASRQASGVKVRDMLPNVKPAADGSFSADFAEAAPSKRPIVTLTAAEAERELAAIRRAFPELTRDYDLEIGLVEDAMRRRGYLRLLDYGYTAERFEGSVRAQDPLSVLPQALRRPFVQSLTPDEQEQLRQAYAFYGQMSGLRGAGRQLFPSQSWGERGLQRYQTSPRTDRLQHQMQRVQDEDLTEAQRRADADLRRALQRHH